MTLVTKAVIDIYKERIVNITSAIGLEFLTDVSMTKATNSANDQHGFMDKRICEVLTVHFLASQHLLCSS